MANLEMVDRYIYAVTRRLPQSKREDIAKELKSLIDDMLEERVQGKATEKDVEEVLLALGNPKKLAQQYLGMKKYLIGPVFIELYLYILKIIIVAFIAALSLIFLVQTILSPIAFLNNFIDFIVSIITGIPQAIGWLTLVFVILERFSDLKVDDLSLDKQWSPKFLPSVPDPNRRIKRCQPFIGIAFYVLLIIFCVFSSEFIGIFVFQDGKFFEVIPFLNMETYSANLPLIIIILGLFMLKDFLKLASEKWTVKLVVFIAIIYVTSLILLSWLVVFNTTFWNPDFIQQLVQSGFFDIGIVSYNTVQMIWSNFGLYIVVIFTVLFIFDIVVGVVKIFKSIR